MYKLFEIVFLQGAFEFLGSLDRKHYEKFFTIFVKPRLKPILSFSKSSLDEVWEFRTFYQGLQYRLLAFWDKTTPTETLVVSTHGFIKKRSKVPDSEIQKAKQIRTKYFSDKEKSKK